MREVIESQGYDSWSFKKGPTLVTYEGGFILQKDGAEDKKLMHGTGTMRMPDGRVYRGQFAFNKFNGEGFMEWPDGTKYVGQYRENTKNGIGKLSYPDGSSFEGHWNQGMRHGDFLHIDKEGDTFLLQYNSEQIVESLRVHVPSGCAVKPILKPGYAAFIETYESPEPYTGPTESREAHEVPTCCICMCDVEVGESCCRMPCSHIFHEECIKSWTEKKLQCPLCMEKIPALKIELDFEPVIEPSVDSRMERIAKAVDDYMSRRTSQESDPSRERSMTGKTQAHKQLLKRLSNLPGALGLPRLQVK